MSQFKPFTAYVVDCVRTAGGRRNGALSEVHPTDLGAHCVDALVERNKFDGALIDDVIFGCVGQYGAQAGNVGRNVVLSCKRVPITVPGTSVDRQCGSSQQALHFAAQAVMSGTQDVVVAGGVEVMSLIPIGSQITEGMSHGRGLPKGAAMEEKWPGIMFSQFEGAEMLAVKYNISRRDMEEVAVESHRRADVATREGRFKEIVPIKVVDPKTKQTIVHDKDEGIRWPASVEQMAKLKTLKPDGRITPAIASQICDGASAVLICNERGLAKLGLKPMARVAHMALAGSDPVVMLEGPIPATQNLLRATGMTIAQIDLVEINEAFASVPMSAARALGIPLDKLNVNGGAMALGHPLGGTGTKLVGTLLNELERRKARFGLLAICEGGGTANATLFERIDAAEWAASAPKLLDQFKPKAKL